MKKRAKKFAIPLFFLLFAVRCAGAATPEEPVQPLALRVLELQRDVQGQGQRLQQLESQLQNRGLLNLLNQVEQMKEEIARLRGQQEEQAHAREQADTRAKALFADVDDRIKAMETRVVTTPVVVEKVSEPVTPPPERVETQPRPETPAVNQEGEARAYEAAYNLVKAGRYKEAIKSFQDFSRNFPASALAANAYYWSGFSQVGLADFRNAAESYKQLIQLFPQSQKVPDALLSLARAQVQMNAQAEAVATLEKLLARFPHARAAINGKKLLATLK